MQKNIIVIVTLFLIIIASYLLLHSNIQKLPLAQTATPTPTQTQTPTDPLTTTSPSGAKKVTITYLPLTNANQPTQTAKIYLQNGTTKTLLWTQAIGRAQDLSIQPHVQVWTKDEKYMYVVWGGPDAVNPLIFRTDNKIFSNGKSYFELATAFTKQTGYIISNMYGWNSEGKFVLSAMSGWNTHPPLQHMGNYTFDPNSEKFLHQY